MTEKKKGARPYVETKSEGGVSRVSTRLVRVGRFAAMLPTLQPLDVDEIPYELEILADVEEGEPVGLELFIRRRKGGPPITTEGVRRLPVSRLVKLAVVNAPLAGVPSRTADGVMVRPFRSAAEEEDYSRTVAGRRPRKREDSNARLRRVADTYREALVRGEPPSLAVRDVEGVSAEHARRLVQQARTAGFLGPAPRSGKAGEVPVKRQRKGR